MFNWLHPLHPNFLIPLVIKWCSFCKVNQWIIEIYTLPIWQDLDNFSHCLLFSQKIVLGAKIPLSQSQIEFSRAGWREERNVNVMTFVKSNVYAKIILWKEGVCFTPDSIFGTKIYGTNEGLGGSAEVKMQKLLGNSNLASFRFISQSGQFEPICYISLHASCSHPLPFPRIWSFAHI